MPIQHPIEMTKAVEFERELGNEPIVREWLESYGWISRFEFGGRGLWVHTFFREGDGGQPVRKKTTEALFLCLSIPDWFLPYNRRFFKPAGSDSETPQPQRWIPTSRFLPTVLDLGGTYLPKVEEVK